MIPAATRIETLLALRETRPNRLDSPVAEQIPATVLDAFHRETLSPCDDEQTTRFLETPTLETAPLVGTHVGPYKIEAEIARGGMGVVYRARQEGLERRVALKLISTGVLAGEEERKRFESRRRPQHSSNIPGSSRFMILVRGKVTSFFP